MNNVLTSEFNSNGFNIESTFDSMMPTIEQTDEIISPLNSLLGQKTEAITFTHKFFLQQPYYHARNHQNSKKQYIYHQHEQHLYS